MHKSWHTKETGIFIQSVINYDLITHHHFQWLFKFLKVYRALPAKRELFSIRNRRTIHILISVYTIGLISEEFPDPVSGQGYYIIYTYAIIATIFLIIKELENKNN